MLQICNSDDLWEVLYKDHMGADHEVGDELRSLAEAVGWKKLFFTNKLQLQVALRVFFVCRSRTQQSGVLAVWGASVVR